jgi:hypothetical protein
MADDDRRQQAKGKDEREPDVPRKYVLAGFAALALAGAATAALWLQSRRDMGSKAPPKGAPVYFVGVAPIAIDLNEDGVEDFAAVARDAKGALAVVGYNGKTLREVWHVGGFEQLDRAKLVAAKDRVIAIDGRNVAHVIQVRSGSAQRDVKLPAAVTATCSSGAEGYVGLADESVIVIDVDAGTYKAAPEGTGDCARVRRCTRVPHMRAACTDDIGPTGPRIESFHVNRILREGALAVAIGNHSPGSATPMIAGLESGKPEPRWVHGFLDDHPADVAEGTPLLGDLVGGVLYVPWMRTNGGDRASVSAFDAASGNRTWETPVTGTTAADVPRAFTVTDARVYLVAGSKLAVIERAGGKLDGVVDSR